MPSYAAGGLVGGLILLGALIYTIFRSRPQQERHNSESGFNPGPGYDRPRDDWGADNHGAGQRPGRRRGKAECAICKESLAKEGLRNLPCKHAFHDTCITQWFRESKTCPTCRHPV